MKRIFVGNIPYTVGHSALKELFDKFGTVLNAKVITDDEGRSKGFGFVEYGTDEGADTAVKEMNGKEHNGRQLDVSIAKNQD